MDKVALAKELCRIAKSLSADPIDEKEKARLQDALGHLNAAEVQLSILSDGMPRSPEDSEEVQRLRLWAKKNIAKATQLVQQAMVLGINTREEFFDKYRKLVSHTVVASEAHHFFDGSHYYADTDFINKVQRVYPDAELVHIGMGEFVLKTPDGELEFDRMRGIDFPGQSGRSHKLYDNAHGKVVQKAISLMERSNASELVKTAAKLSFDAWMKEVDKAVEDKAGCSVHDLEDCPFRDWYDDGVSPKSAASKAIRNSKNAASKKKDLTVPEQHSKNIAIKTLRMPDAMVGVMGGPSKAEAREALKEFGYTDAEIAKLEK